MDEKSVPCRERPYLVMTYTYAQPESCQSQHWTSNIGYIAESESSISKSFGGTV